MTRTLPKAIKGYVPSQHPHEIGDYARFGDYDRDCKRGARFAKKCMVDSSMDGRFTLFTIMRDMTYEEQGALRIGFLSEIAKEL